MSLPEIPVGLGRTVIVGPVRYAELCGQGRDLLLSHGFTLIENESTVPWTQEELVERIADADATIAGVEVYGADVLDRAPKLRILSRLGVGLDNVDLEAARERGVEVVNVPGGNATAVSELAIAFMLALLRRLTEMDAATKEGRWDRYVGRELAGKRIGLIGFGAIGRTLTRRLRGFDVDIAAFDPFADAAAAAELGVTLVDSLDELLAGRDIVSVHAPHLPSTHHTINDRTIALMSPGTLVVNTSRGGLVDEAALLRGLLSGHLGGAGLDVFEHEPVDPANPLLAHPAVVVAPHAAADSREAYERIGLITAEAVVRTFADQTTPSLAR